MNDLVAVAHPVLEALRNHILSNFPEYITLFSAIAIAGVCMMPKTRPKSIDDWYTWVRDTLQTAVPAARAQREVHSLTETTTPASTTKQEVIATNQLNPAPVVPVVDPTIQPPKEG